MDHTATVMALVAGAGVSLVGPFVAYRITARLLGLLQVGIVGGGG